MSIRLSCRRGHQWETEQETKSTCPVCGAAGETVTDGETYSTVPAEEDGLPRPAEPPGEEEEDDDLLTLEDFRQPGDSDVPREFGRYEIVRPIGRGGMGRVFLARDTQLDRQVAIKVPHFSKKSSNLLERFQREARAAATLDHPNICSVYDVGQIEGVDYITMAYIEGKPLSRLIKDQHPLPQSAVADLVRKLALAMQEAHDKGIVHRDLKPDNVMVNLRYEPVIMDFGLAQRASQSDVKLTARGAVMGSPAYMSPEQVAGKTDEIGPASDVYSLGVVLYELLTGRLPFQGSLGEVLAQIAKDDPDPPSQHRSDLHSDLEQICLRAMANKPSERFSSMAEFADALSEYLEGRARTPLPSGQQPSRSAPAADNTGALASGDRAEELLEKLVAKLQSAPALAAPETRPAAAWKWVIAVAALLLLVGFGLPSIINRPEPPQDLNVTNVITVQQVLVDLDITKMIQQPDVLLFLNGNQVSPEQLESTIEAGQHELVVKSGERVIAQRAFAVDVRENEPRVVALEPPTPPSLTIEKQTDRTGVQLMAGNEDIPQPRQWYIRTSSGDEVASSENWEYREVPPGKYHVALLPQGYYAQQIQWIEVEISDGDSATIRVDSGVTLSPQMDDEVSPQDWYVYASGEDEPLARVHQRWGFTPLPPGDYVIKVLPRGYGAVPIPWCEFSVEQGRVESITIDSGIELAGRDGNDPTPADWYIYAADSGEAVARVNERWGFTPLPAGDYVINVLPRGYGAMPIPWQQFSVEPGQVATINVDSGLALAGRSGSEPTLDDWYVYPAGSNTAIARVNERWGYTPLPPGDYSLSVTPRGYAAKQIRWQDFSVKPGQVDTIKVDSGIELLGRHGNDPSPEDWYVYPTGLNTAVARVNQRWGFTPLTPGDYTLKLTPRGYDAVLIRWHDFSIGPAQVETVRVNSGITLSGHMPRDRAIQDWYVNPTGSKQPLAHVNGRWGFTPLRPGRYDIYLLPGKRGSQSIRWQGNVAVEENKITEVTVKSGIELVAPAPYHKPPQRWEVFHASSRQRVTEVSAGWCWTPLRPGDYYVQVQHGEHQGRSKVISVLPDKVTDVTLADVGIAVEQPPQEQRTGIALWGASRNEMPPASWLVYETATNEKVAQVGTYNGASYTGRRWGFTQLKPGNYRVCLLPHDSGAVEHVWDEVSVVAGEVAELKVDSGIELVAGHQDYPPPAAWYVYDTETDVKVAQVGKYNGASYTGRRWGFTPLRPGSYRVSLLPHDSGAVEQLWGEVIVKRGETSTVSVNSGVELTAESDDLRPPNFWTVHDAPSGVRVAQVGKHNGAWYEGSRWGFTPLPPGEYRVAAPYQEAHGESSAFKIEPGQVKRLTLADLGLTAE